MATHSSILAWEIPWTEEPVGATVLGVTRVGHDLVKRQQHQDPLSWGWESYPLLPSHWPLLLLLLSHFSRVRLCATPETQPTRLPCPWDFPGKNTGVGCHFLLQCMKVKSEREVAQLCPTPSNPMDCSLPGSSIHGIFQARVLEWGARDIFFFFSPTSYFPSELHSWGGLLPQSCQVRPSSLMLLPAQTLE